MRSGAKPLAWGGALAGLLALALLAACAAPSAGASVPSTATPLPSALPASMPAPSSTATPTATPSPAPTPAPTATPSPAPTATEAPPSPSPTVVLVAPRTAGTTAAIAPTPTAVAATPLPAPATLPPATPAAAATAARVASLATPASGPLTVPAGVVFPGGREGALYAQAIARGRDGAMFTVAGDSNSEWSGYLGQIATGAFDLRPYPTYAAAAARFGPSWPRHSVAAEGGLRAADMFTPTWPTKPAACAPDEGRFVCELRLSRASIVFVQLGTGDRFVWQDYEANLRRMIDTALAAGVLPILVTKADDLESWQGGAPIDYLNGVVRRLAAAYQIPLIDFWVATRGLPVIPNPQLPDRPFTKNGLLDEWGYYFHLSDQGKQMRILTTLAMLAAIGR